jgi:hypothetical protein
MFSRCAQDERCKAIHVSFPGSLYSYKLLVSCTFKGLKRNACFFLDSQQQQQGQKMFHNEGATDTHFCESPQGYQEGQPEGLLSINLKHQE